MKTSSTASRTLFLTSLMAALCFGQPASADPLEVGDMPSADLTVTASVDRDFAIAGEELTYTLSVANAGPDQAPSTDLTIELPDDVSLISTSGCVDDPNGLPICKLQTVDAAASKEASFKVLVGDGARGELTLTALAESSRDDPNPEDNMITVVTAISTETVVATGSSPAIASDPTATQQFVIAWEAPTVDPLDAPDFGGSGGISAQLFSATGMPVGIELRLDQSGATHGGPDVARRANGNFVAVWQSEDADGSGVFGRLFDATGMPVGIEMRLNDQESLSQSQPAVAGFGDGRFLVAWSDEESLGSFVRALRLFNAAGMPVGIELRFGASDISAKPAAAAISSQGILVTWEDAADRIAAQLFNHSGMPVGIEFHPAPAGTNAAPRAAAHPDGGFVVVWQNDDDTDGSGVFGRRLDATGMPVGIEFRINEGIAGNQERPAIAAAPDGTFAVTWQGPDSDGTGIYSRRLDATGMPVGIEIRASLAGTGDQTGSEPAFVDQDGTFYVAWQSDEEEDSEIVIAPPSLFFADGFESGDLSAWSETRGSN